MDPRFPWNFEVEHLTDSLKIRIFANKMSRGRLFASGLSFLLTTLFLVLFLIISLKVSTRIYQVGAFDLTAVFFFLLFLAGFLVLTLTGIQLGYFFIWKIAGVEILEVRYGLLKSQKTIFGKGQVKEYKSEQIADIALGEVTILPRSLFTQISWMFSGKLMGQIIVRLSDGQIDYLGLGLFHEQAAELIEILRGALFTKPA